ncbi:Taurine catabolism dioxygenase TauD/TfdA [Niveomyces insectorum RCEF 264]|uniref:Taurine catabolism dioxygenase TauD/TfdA n=1 Tax=Niveomyces insectorum RCEF 264 TaxID=1081102 RepID=A0A168AAQ1_9HYPO|nr:Taurine catabolism dioxygenase TauD/TfdA [Niveomyces insectorum RCEF 264]
MGSVVAAPHTAGKPDVGVPLFVSQPVEIASPPAGLELDGEQVSKDTFPLPVLGPKLDELSAEVYNGRGFCLVRGIKPEDYSVEDLMLVYLGIQGRIGDQRGRQDSRGNMLVHIVADDSSKTRTEHHRHSNKSITFHNEETGDVVGWLTRNTASSGGRCIIASAYTVYNVLASRRPDLLRLLARSDWPFAFPRFQCRPIIFHQDGKLIMNFGRTALLGNAIHPRSPRLPSITARQLEALDAMEAIAQATQLEVPTQAGDMHFINNLAVLHRREAFMDGAATTEKRHLVRMRLRSTQLGWSIPAELEDIWAQAFNAEARRVWHLEPMPEAFFPLRKYPN